MLDVAREVIASIPPGGTTLELTGHITKINDDGLLQLLHEIRDLPLKTLLLENWHEPNVAQLRSLFMVLGGRLERIVLSGTHVTDEQLQVFTAHLCSVRELSLRSCKFVSSRGMRAIVRGCHETLKVLDLSYSPKITNDCLGWISGALGACSLYCSRLVSIDISGCKSIDDVGMAYLGRGCKNLRFLHCSGCARISDMGFQSLCPRLGKLQVVRMPGCPNVGDAALVALGAHCHKLKSLNVSRCGNITDYGLKHLADGCPRLQALNIAGATNITEEGLCRLAQTCKGIHTMNLTGCTNVTSNGLNALVSGIKYVRKASSFMGFVPTDEAILEKFSDQTFYLEENAAMRFQNAFMKKVNKRWGRRYLLRLRLGRAATTIQRCFRRYVKKLMFSSLDQVKVRHTAVVSMQRVFRGFSVRRVFQAELEKRKALLKFAPSAIKIQKIYRGHAARKGNLRVVRAINNLYLERRIELYNAAAVYIQTLFRKYKARERVAALMEIRNQRQLDMKTAAVSIQCYFRQFHAREVLYQLRLEKVIKRLKSTLAAGQIQSAWWGYKGCRDELEAMRKKKALERAMQRGALRFQTCYRQYRAKQEVDYRRRLAALRFKAAVIIQKVFRSSRIMRWPHLKLNKLATEIWDTYEQELEIASERNRILRPKLLAALRVPEEPSDDSLDEAADEDAWQELWDDAMNCPYWYNAVLNETTYEPPQPNITIENLLVGKQVRVFWPVENQWFVGTVTKFNKGRKVHKVEYADGDQEWLDANEERDRLQVYDGNAWVMFGMYEPLEIKEHKAIIQQKKRKEKQNAAKLREAKEWVELADEGQEEDGETYKKTRARMQNSRTGEIRFKAEDADHWDLTKDSDGNVCYYNKLTNRFSYDNPKLARKDDLQPHELEASQEQVLAEVYHKCYLIQNMLEDYAKLMSDKEKRNYFRKKNKDCRQTVKALAGNLAVAKDLWGSGFERHEYLRYAEEVVRRGQEVSREMEAMQEITMNLRRKMLDVEKSSQTSQCRTCGHDIPRTSNYCPVCGDKYR